jgi:hypothetical protein
MFFIKTDGSNDKNPWNCHVCNDICVECYCIECRFSSKNLHDRMINNQIATHFL